MSDEIPDRIWIDKSAVKRAAARKAGSYYFDEGDEGIEYVRASLAAWRSIETAPKTGERILLAHANSVWEDEWWNGEDANWLECVEGGTHMDEVPTHWMPLPDPPEQPSS